jgi:hypothetical protein
LYSLLHAHCHRIHHHGLANPHKLLPLNLLRLHQNGLTLHHNGLTLSHSWLETRLLVYDLAWFERIDVAWVP